MTIFLRNIGFQDSWTLIFDLKTETLLYVCFVLCCCVLEAKHKVRAICRRPYAKTGPEAIMGISPVHGPPVGSSIQFFFTNGRIPITNGVWGGPKTL